MITLVVSALAAILIGIESAAGAVGQKQLSEIENVLNKLRNYLDKIDTQSASLDPSVRSVVMAMKDFLNKLDSNKYLNTARSTMNGYQRSAASEMALNEIKSDALKLAKHWEKVSPETFPSDLVRKYEAKVSKHSYGHAYEEVDPTALAQRAIDVQQYHSMNKNQIREKKQQEVWSKSPMSDKKTATFDSRPIVREETHEKE